jgi:hypothetical protein
MGAAGKIDPGCPMDWLLLLAIAERRLVGLVYRGRARIGEPHDYGLRKGTDQLNFFQTAGTSSSGRLDWRTLHVSAIEGLLVLDRHFSGTRATPSGAHLGWDELYASVTPRLLQVPPAPTRRSRAGASPS